MTELSIIIAVLGKSEYLDGCLASIKRNTKAKYETIIIDTSSPRIGIAKAWNQGVNKSCAENLIFLNDDTIVTKDWYELMKQELYNDSIKVGAVVPTLSCKGKNDFSSQCDTFLKLNTSKDFSIYSIEQIERIALLVKGLANITPVRYKNGEFLCGCCMLTRRKIYDEVGGFDERFKAYCEDVDFLDRIGALGYKLSWQQEAFVFHYGGKTAEKVNDFNRSESYKLYLKNKMKRRL